MDWKLFFQRVFSDFVGSGAALALASAIYYQIIKGRVKIPSNFDCVHSDYNSCRHRIRVYNKGWKSLHNIVCYITFKDLSESDLDKSGNAEDYLISPGNFKAVEHELIIWDTGEASFDLHPKQYIDVDLLHYHKDNEVFIVPSEQGYTKKQKSTKARMRVGNIKEYDFEVQFFATDYCSDKYAFKIIPKQDKSDLLITRWF